MTTMGTHQAYFDYKRYQNFDLVKLLGAFVMTRGPLDNFKYIHLIAAIFFKYRTLLEKGLNLYYIFYSKEWKIF